MLPCFHFRNPLPDSSATPECAKKEPLAFIRKAQVSKQLND